jgi:hypothetical protein
MLSDFDVIDGYQRLVSRWYWVVAAGMIGGLIGLLASQFRPPVYQASALIGIGIDRGRADIPQEATVRQAYDRVRGLLLADDVLDRAVSLSAERAGGEPSAESSAAMRGRIRLVERPDGWELIVYGPAGPEAERLAQAWADASLEGIAAASVHALRAAEWQNILFEALPPGSQGVRCGISPVALRVGPVRNGHRNHSGLDPAGPTSRASFQFYPISPEGSRDQPSRSCGAGGR